MGYLIYGSSEKYVFDDRVLAHLQIVIGAKLRRRESFFCTWASGPDVGGSRTALWLDPTVPLQFHYDSRPASGVNRAWVEALTVSANSPGGLIVTDESPEADRAQS